MSRWLIVFWLGARRMGSTMGDLFAISVPLLLASVFLFGSVYFGERESNGNENNE